MIRLGYKKCAPLKNKNDRVIGVFEIPEINYIISNTFAKYKVSKCKLIRVESICGKILDIEEVKSVILFNSDPDIIYKLNELVEEDTECINMFFERCRAEHYLLEYKENGPLIKWRDNGIIYSEENFLNYKLNGLVKYYHPNGNIKEETNYINGNINGIQKIYDLSGSLIKTNDLTIRPHTYTYKT